MSGINGDKARFNRERKQRQHKRERNKKMLEGMAKQKSSAAALAGKSKETAA